MFDGIEKFLYWWSSFFLEGDVDALCRLRAPLSEDTWVTTSGDLLSVFKIRGTRMLVGDEEYRLLTSRLAKRLSILMRTGKGGTHSFAFGFRSHPDGGKAVVQRLLRPMSETMERMGIHGKAKIVVQAREKHLGALMSDESVYLVVVTHADSLSPHEAKRENEQRRRVEETIRKASGGSQVSDQYAQSPRIGPVAIIPRHAAMIERLIDDLGKDVNKDGIALLLDKLNVHDGAAVIRKHISGVVQGDWRPRLLGDRAATAAASTPGKRGKDASSAFPIRVGRQMVSDPCKDVFGDVEMTYRAGLYYASVVLDQMPSEGSARFNSLAEGIGRRIPWTVNFEILPNGLDRRKAEQFYAAFLGGFGENNKRIKSAWDDLKARKNAGEIVGTLRAVFTTWSSTERGCIDNLSFLKNSVEQWDSSVATNETGAPSMAALTSAAGYSDRGVAPYIPAPLDDICRMMPIFRSASVWDTGQILLKTDEGLPYPIELGSTLQNFWGTGIFAPTGSGKSVFMLAMNLGFALGGGLSHLGYITNIDVGPSGKLLVELLHGMLPKERHHEAVYLRVRNSREFATNPFDTHLGLDQPTNVDEEFGQVVLGTICPSIDREDNKFLGMVLREAYAMLGRDSPTCKVWQPSINEDLHAKAMAAGIPYEPGKTRVWDLVDAFFAKGMIVEASSVQRYAVPLLQDMIRASRATNIMNLYRTKMIGNEAIHEVFTREITTAIDQYRLIAAPTQFDVGMARVIVVDLEEVVAGSQTEESKRRSQMMYLFARRLGARKFFLRWEGEMEAITPPAYAEYHKHECQAMGESPKLLEYDEIHNAGGAESAMMRQIVKDMREGRKYLTVTVMSSQRLDDFPPDAVDNCYNFFVLGMGSQTSSDSVAATFGLSPSEHHAVESHCTMPGKLFGFFKTRRGRLSQTLSLDLSPFERWCWNTDKEDAELRAQMAERVPYMEVLEKLASKFPNGTARDVLRSMRIASSGGASTEKLFVSRLVDKLLTEDVDA